VIKKPIVKSTTINSNGVPLTPAVVHNAAQVAMNHSMMILPPPIVFNPTKKTKKAPKQAITFDKVLDFLKNGPKDVEEEYSIQNEQFFVLEDMFQIVDKKEIVKLLLEKMKVSRFKSYKMAMKNFSNILDSYFEGNSTYTDVCAWAESNIPTHASEHWYEEFNDLRTNIIQSLSNSPKVEPKYALVDAVKALVNAEIYIKYNDDVNGEDFEKQERLATSLYYQYMIDTAQLIWPEQAKSLKLLFGNK